MQILHVIAKLVGLCLFAIMSVALSAQTVLIHESFDDEYYAQRGWYDNSNLVITKSEHCDGSTACLEFHFPKGARTANGGAVRHLFNPSSAVYLSYWVKYSLNWTGSNKPYHPHQFHFVTTESDRYVGPSYTALTLYIEENEGYPVIAMQDAKNIDTTHIKQSLKGISETRAVSGCNGSSDGYPTGDCYFSGGLWFNGKQWKSEVRTFSQDQGPYFQNDWHHIEAYFQLNSIENGVAMADGIARYWYDDSLLIDARDIMLRTGIHPSMLFNQFLIAPYIGDGSPVDQTMWVDEVTVADKRPINTGVEDNVSIDSEDFDVEVFDILGRVVQRFRPVSGVVDPLTTLHDKVFAGTYIVRTKQHGRNNCKLVFIR